MRFVLKYVCVFKEKLIILPGLAPVPAPLEQLPYLFTVSVMATNSFIMTVKWKWIILLVLTLYNRGCLVTIFLMCVTFPKQIMLRKTFH